MASVLCSDQDVRQKTINFQGKELDAQFDAQFV
jgi:hypothetical protein